MENGPYDVPAINCRSAVEVVLRTRIGATCRAGGAPFRYSVVKVQFAAVLPASPVSSSSPWVVGVGGKAPNVVGWSVFERQCNRHAVGTFVCNL